MKKNFDQLVNIWEYSVRIAKRRLPPVSMVSYSQVVIPVVLWVIAGCILKIRFEKLIIRGVEIGWKLKKMNIIFIT